MLKGQGRDLTKDSNLDEIDDSRLGQIGPDGAGSPGYGCLLLLLFKTWRGSYADQSDSARRVSYAHDPIYQGPEGQAPILSLTELWDLIVPQNHGLGSNPQNIMSLSGHHTLIDIQINRSLFKEGK